MQETLIVKKIEITQNRSLDAMDVSKFLRYFFFNTAICRQQVAETFESETIRFRCFFLQ